MQLSSLNFRGLAGVFLALTLALSGSGCIYLFVGAAGAVGGYVVSPDTVEGTVSASLSEAWDAAKEITKIMGSITEENEQLGQLTATISGARVTITIMALNAASSKLSVKARKSFMPKIDIAQDVYTKIVNGIAGN